jgi:cephalosporin-C deacetylase
MAVAGLERFRPNADKPTEFLRFWALTVAELQRTRPEAERLGAVSPEPGLLLERLRYTSLNGVRVAAYLLRPTEAQSRPLVVHAHGYNDRYEVMLDWARRGCSVFGFDARGFGRSADRFPISEHGYVLTGIESPQTSVLRGAVADYLQGVRVATERLGALAASSVSLYGFSFGGALALMAGALSRQADLVVLGQPTFGWNAERSRVALAGSAREVRRYIERFPWRRDTVIETLQYFDTLHFAPLVDVPTLIGIGLDDDVVPSRTVLAVANHFASPVEVRLLPVSHSADPRESLWQAFDEEWLAYVANGLPRDFGATDRQVRVLLA